MKIILASLITLLAAAGFFFGVASPMYVSHGYIFAVTHLSQARSLDNFNQLFDPVFSFYSPIGRDEVFGGYLQIVFNALGQNPPPPPAIVQALIAEVESRAAPILEKGHGFNYGQNLLRLGVMYRQAAVAMHDAAYLDKAIAVFLKAREVSPLRPPFLYNLLELYAAKQDYGHAREMAEAILRYWPQDEQVRNFLKALATASSSRQ